MTLKLFMSLSSSSPSSSYVITINNLIIVMMMTDCVDGDADNNYNDNKNDDY